MFKKQYALVASIIIALVVMVAGCKSKFEKLKASNDNAKKYQEAVRLYNKKEYSKALELFEGLTQRYRGQTGAEDLFYYYAYTNFKLKDYTSASYHFKQFAETYPTSTRAEECRYMTAYCYYLDSPNFSLDQANTQKSIDALQLFINLYPKSERVAEASKLIQNLRDRLEEKAYANAKLYYTIGDYQSAVIAMGNMVRDYPDTKYAEEMDYLSVKAQYEFARVSRETRQEDRYTTVISFANQFGERYPNSKYLRDVEQYKRYSDNGIKNARRVMAQAMVDPKKAKKLEKQDSTVTIKTPASEDPKDHQRTPPQE